MTDSTYAADIHAWRAKREAGLRAPDGWLSLAGLFILEDGEHRVGGAADNDVTLPPTAPAHLGVLRYANGAATLDVTCAETVTVDGAPARHAALKDNSAGAPTVVGIGSTTFFIHAFSGIHAVRVKDSANPARAAFPGCVWFDVDARHNVRARFTPNPAPRVFAVGTSVKTGDSFESVGTLDFELNGAALRLHAESGGRDNALFIIFRDATSGKQTYGASRYLTATLDPDGTAELDFNKAYNPPCAVTPYATCKLAPPDNVLRVPIEAGEKYDVARAH